MPIDPQIQHYLDRMAAANAPALWEVPVATARETTDALRRMAVTDRAIPGPAGDIPVRIFRPASAGQLPCLVYYHGGGWVTGSLDSTDMRCRVVAEWTPCVVISVDYRMAPEYPFPAAVDDSYAAAQWATANAAAYRIDPARIGVGGDSAGGNLAAAVALKARDEGLHLALQYLCYPVTNPLADSASRREFATGHGLTQASMDWYERQYLPDPTLAEHPHAAPLRAPDLTGLPPAIIAIPGNDVLRDEGLAYAERLKAAGVAVELHEYPGLIHGFFGQPGESDAAKHATVDSCKALRDAFARA